MQEEHKHTQAEQSYEASTNVTVDEGKTMAVVAYLTLIGLVAALVMNGDKKNTFASFHIRQSLGLMVTGLATMLVSWIPLIGWLFGIVAFFLLLFMWLTGLFHALNGREKVLPVLGDKYAEWFKSM